MWLENAACAESPLLTCGCTLLTKWFAVIFREGDLSNSLQVEKFTQSFQAHLHHTARGVFRWTVVYYKNKIFFECACVGVSDQMIKRWLH